MSDNEVLSQDEMDALLDGVSSGDVDTQTEPTGTSGEVRTYDFRRPAHILNAQLPGLESVNERFANAFQERLFGMLARPVRVMPTHLVMNKYFDYTTSLPIPFSVHAVHVDPLNGIAQFGVDAKLVFMIVDGYFGGGGAISDADVAREFTPTERRIIERLLVRACDDLMKAWAPVTNLTFKYLDDESITKGSCAPGPDEILVVSKFQVEFESGSGEFHCGIPYTLLEPVRPLLTSSVQKELAESNEQWQMQLTQRVSRAKVELKSIFAESEISLRDLMRLTPGDFVPLAMGDTVSLQAENIPIFDGTVGVSNGVACTKIVGRHKNTG